MIARLKLVEPCHENRQVDVPQVIDARAMPAATKCCAAISTKPPTLGDQRLDVVLARFGANLEMNLVGCGARAISCSIELPIESRSAGDGSGDIKSCDIHRQHQQETGVVVRRDAQG
jgi:hypothetical protein